MSDTEARGRRVLIRFDGTRCIHARNCVVSRPDVFTPNTDGAWIHPDNATPEEIVALAQACPSGAIGYERLDGGPQEAAPRVNLVRVRENGPLAIHAPLTIVGEGVALRATLCRCGVSRNKPFCDGSHVRAGFVATGEPQTRDSQPLALRDGPVTVTPLVGGPLLVEGNLEICSGTGRTLNRITRTALCRCGHSANKPYCDGSHHKVGFITE